MLNPPDHWQLQGLMLTARRLAEGLNIGRHHSTRQGSGLEFYDHRAYCPGDEVARVDWKLFGRTNRHYVRSHRQTGDLRVYVLVDHTASMNFAGLDRRGRPRLGPDAQTKLGYAKILAAAIGYLTVRHHDRVGLGLFSDKLDHHTPSGGTWAHFHRFCWALERAQAASGPGDLANSLRHAHSLMSRRSLVVVISDLLDEPESWLGQLKRLRHDRFEVILFQVITGQELDLAALGDLRLKMVDAETDRTVGTHIPKIQHHYRKLMSEHLATLRNSCTGLGIDYNLVSTDQPAVGSLRRYLIRRGAING